MKKKRFLGMSTPSTSKTTSFGFFREEVNFFFLPSGAIVSEHIGGISV
jgi:hypothetical protein